MIVSKKFTEHLQHFDIIFVSGAVSFGGGSSPDSLIFDRVSSCGSATVDMSSLRPLPWLSTEDCQVGGAMCHITPLTEAGSTPPIVSPRAAALKQITKLREEFNLDIKSAFEMELMVFEVTLLVFYSLSSKCITN